MNSPRSPWVKFLRAALLIVLLAAQGLAAAHEFAHWKHPHPAQEMCAACSLSSGLDAPMASSPPVLAAPLSTCFAFDYSTIQVHVDAPAAFFQRAPPVSL